MLLKQNILKNPGVLFIYFFKLMACLRFVCGHAQADLARPSGRRHRVEDSNLAIMRIKMENSVLHPSGLRTTTRRKKRRALSPAERVQVFFCL